MKRSTLAHELCLQAEVYYYLKKAKVLTLACSGGSDSVALFFLLLELQNTFSYHLQLAYFNHQLRVDSTEEEFFVKRLAGEHDVSLFLQKWERRDVQHPSEAAAREARYSFLQQFCRPEKEEYLVLAHHQNDQAETVMLNLLRGAGLRGLSGMKRYQKGIFRPLLDHPKSDILAYLNEKKLAFCTDYTNTDERFRRNFLRQKIFPAISAQFNFDLSSKLGRTAASLQEIYDYLQQETRTFLSQLKAESLYWSGDEVVLDASVLTDRHPALIKEAVAGLYRYIHPRAVNLNREQVDVIANLLSQNRSEEKRLNLADGLVFSMKAPYFSVFNSRKIAVPHLLQLQHEDLAFSQYCLVTKDLHLPFEKVMNQRGLISGLEVYVIENKASFVYNNKIWNVPLDLCQNSFFRTRREGDRVLMTNGHHKSLKKLLQEFKIPASVRDKLLLLAVDNLILWPFGSDRSKHGKENC